MNKVQREILRTSIAQLSGAQVVYEREQSPFVSPTMSGLITISRVSNTVSGVADQRYELVGNSLYSEIVEWRYQTLGIRWDVYDPSGSAVDDLTDMSTRLWRQAVVDACRSTGLVLVDSRDVIDLDFTVDGHQYSSASMDLRVSYAFSDVDVDTDLGVIQHVPFGTNFQ